MNIKTNRTGEKVNGYTLTGKRKSVKYKSSSNGDKVSCTVHWEAIDIDGSLVWKSYCDFRKKIRGSKKKPGKKTTDRTGEIRSGHILTGNNKSVNGIIHYEFKCYVCESIDWKPLSSITGSKSCKNCYVDRSSGYMDISGLYLASVKACAKNRNIEYNLEVEYLWDMFIKQNRKCKLSGLDIKFEKSYSGRSKRDQTASLDRIDSSIRKYEKGNVQWVHKDVNLMKMDLPEETFLELCRLITKERFILCQ